MAVFSSVLADWLCFYLLCFSLVWVCEGLSEVLPFGNFRKTWCLLYLYWKALRFLEAMYLVLRVRELSDVSSLNDCRPTPWLAWSLFFCLSTEYFSHIPHATPVPRAKGQHTVPASQCLWTVWVNWHQFLSVCLVAKIPCKALGLNPV